MKPQIFLVFALAFPVICSAQAPVFGGHVRINYDQKDWGNPEDDSQFGLESVKLTVKGKSDNIDYKVDYRWYENTEMTVVKFADFTLNLDDSNKVSAGITQVPFGLLSYASNSFWFSINFYLGFEDDHDAGVVYHHDGGDWSAKVGYFFNEEYNSPTAFGRYAFDVADDGEYRNKENGQWNLRLAKDFQLFANSETELGVSLEQAEILNLNTNQHGDLSAYALHMRHKHGRFKLEYEYLDYEYDLAAPDGQSTNLIALSAYNFPVLAAAKGSSHVVNLAYQLPYQNKLISGLTCYSDYGLIATETEQSNDSYQWVNGCSFAMEDLFIHIDSIRGKNMWFSGGPGVGIDAATLDIVDPNRDEWTHRLHISLGYFF